jgi:hypothetical protein
MHPSTSYPVCNCARTTPYAVYVSISRSESQRRLVKNPGLPGPLNVTGLRGECCHYPRRGRQSQIHKNRTPIVRERRWGPGTCYAQIGCPVRPLQIAMSAGLPRLATRYFQPGTVITKSAIRPPYPTGSAGCCSPHRALYSQASGFCSGRHHPPSPPKRCWCARPRSSRG